jgi:hypothetical protein
MFEKPLKKWQKTEIEGLVLNIEINYASN